MTSAASTSGSARVMVPGELQPAQFPTLYFIGVTTGKSSIQRVFPLWADALGLADANLCGIDVPIHAPAEVYREVVEFIARDPLSMGALVTTHKIDLFAACRDLFDVIDVHAQSMGEVSCISKADGKLVCHAKDPISSGLAIEGFIPRGHWRDSDAEAFLMGAGGSTIAISWYLSRIERGDDRPKRILVSNRSPERLLKMERIVQSFGSDTKFDFVLCPTAADNSRLVSQLNPRSLVVNATGLGKDAPGSPIDDSAVFPEDGIAWDLNYRGQLVFLEQARNQAATRRLHVEDGWLYFLHGWTQVIAEVFHIRIPTSGPEFDGLGMLARTARP